MKTYLYLFLFLFLFLFLISPVILHAQGGDFSYGEVSNQALYMNRYDKDTTANAVVLKEFGRTYIDNNQKNLLVFYYHVRIKILNDRGIDKANFSIPIRKSANGGEKEEVYDIKGSTLNAGAKEINLKQKNIFTENKTRYMDLVKFTLPNVKAGSVIEVEYTLSSPYIYNFRGWNFQSDIPKRYSEYWAKIPANLDYNISLIGYYKLTEDEKSKVSNCLTTFNGGKADCTLMKLGMKDIPAFKEEKYMTAKSNFLSAVHFELSAIHGFDGSTKKVAKTWKDEEQELHTNKYFGIQLKKGKSFFSKTLDTLLTNGSETTKAKRIYAFFQKWYKWNNYTGIFCESSIKKTFEDHQGNIGAINLSLIAALRAAGLNANPVLISTRNNGLPHDLFPAISDFNYLLVQLKTKDSVYLLDASLPMLPFGVFPIRCINGRGRIIYPDKPSAWISITAPVIRQAMFIAHLTLDDHSHITGTITRTYEGYSALRKREEFYQYNSKKEYLDELNSHLSHLKISADSITNLNDPDKPLTERMTVQFTRNSDSTRNKIAFNPFFQSFIRTNPFKSTERHFPVDFGTPEKLFTLVYLQYPADYRLISAPKQTILALPDKGGRYIMGKSGFGNTVIMKTGIQQNKPIYEAKEYPALKEFYSRIIQSQRAELIFSKN